MPTELSEYIPSSSLVTHAHIIDAIKEGKTIQFMTSDGHWLNMVYTDLSHSPECYRVKPKEPEVIEIEKVVYGLKLSAPDNYALTANCIGYYLADKMMCNVDSKRYLLKMTLTEIPYDNRKISSIQHNKEQTYSKVPDNANKNP